MRLTGIGISRLNRRHKTVNAEGRAANFVG
jgi:hypothetical protein